MHAVSSQSWSERDVAFVPPPRRRDIIVNLLDDEAILHDPRSGSIHHLNTNSLTVWRQCDGRRNTHEIARYVARIFDVGASTALDHVERALLRLIEAELLDFRKD